MRFTIPIAVSFLGASVRPSEIIAPGTHSDVAPALVPARTGSHVEDGQLTSRADSQMILEFWKTAPWPYNGKNAVQSVTRMQANSSMS